MSAWLILVVSLLYLLLLFGIAYLADQKKQAGKSLIANPYVFALSMGVYATAWTFFGSVGRAAESGLGFLPIYIGPTLMAILWWVLLRKMIRIRHQERITSIADFLASRYGKSSRLAILVTLIAVAGIIPYIGLQLQAVSSAFLMLSGNGGNGNASGMLTDPALYTALILAAFTILFGTRDLDASERHEGLVAAVAFESVIKLVAFLAAGIWVVWGAFNGPGDLFSQAASHERIPELFTFGSSTIQAGEWFWLTLISMCAIMVLPRQFQVAVIENVSEQHVLKASWLFPLYLFAINIFVIPIAVAGLLLFPDGSVSADTFIISIPLAGGQHLLALVVFIGGLSAATGMVIVAVVALSTMISNDLLIPLMLRKTGAGFGQTGNKQATARLLLIRRLAILCILLLAYLFVRSMGGQYTLVSIGLISFVAVAQFMPALIAGLFWKNGSEKGALAGLLAGVLTWGYTLAWPALESAVYGGIQMPGPEHPESSWLHPYALFGVDIGDPVSHAAFWSLSLNTLVFWGVSLFYRPGIAELVQAGRFVDVLQPDRQQLRGNLIPRTAKAEDVKFILERFLGHERAVEIMETDLTGQHHKGEAGEALIHRAETQLGGVIGASSARTVMASVVRERPLEVDQIMSLLDETRQAIAYSHELEQKSAALEQSTRELKAANEKLRELDELKDEFMFTVTHELKTPLTSIRAFTELLRDNPEMPQEKSAEFLDIITRETQRLSRLISQVLDMQRYEQGSTRAQKVDTNIEEAISNAIQSVTYELDKKGITLQLHPDPLPAAPLEADPDQMEQLFVNLLSNAIKFSPQNGLMRLELGHHESAGHSSDGKHHKYYEIRIHDSGPGIPEKEREHIFEKFTRSKAASEAAIEGTGLGLSIVKSILIQHDGQVQIEDSALGGACFIVRIPHQAMP